MNLNNLDRVAVLSKTLTGLRLAQRNASNKMMVVDGANVPLPITDETLNAIRILAAGDLAEQEAKITYALRECGVNVPEEEEYESGQNGCDNAPAAAKEFAEHLMTTQGRVVSVAILQR